MNINGFEIDKYNQFSLQENSKTSICPLCSSNRKPEHQKQKCLMLDWQTGLGTCQHCGEVIQLHTYKKNKQEKTFEKPVWINKTELSDGIIKYFESRKISQLTLTKMKITEGKDWMPQYKKNVNTIHFNYFLNNELVNIKYRTKNKDFKLHSKAELIFYNLDSIRISKECIVVEGEIDCLSWIESGYLQVVSVPNGSSLKNPNLSYLDNYYEYFENKDKIYLGFDNDEAGQITQKEFIRRVGAEKCYLLNFDNCKDSNEYLCKYGSERLRQLKENAKLVPIENIIFAKDTFEQLHDFYLNGSPKGFTIGLKTFDKNFSTYTGQYIVVTGIPSHGKSDFVDQMIVGYSINYQWKGAICSVENNPKYLHVDKLCRKIAGIKPKSIDELNSEGWKKTENFVNDNFYFIDYESGYDLINVLNKIKELVKRKGIKYFVLDPYNKIRLKESLTKFTTEYTNDYLNEVDSFCRNNDVLGIIVAHPRKPENKFTKDYEPTFYDIKGGGEFYDMSPHGLLVHRDFKRNVVKIKNLKVKFNNLGVTGAECYYGWNPINGRYSELNIDNIDEIEFAQPLFEYENLLDKQNNDNNNYFNFYEPMPF